MNKENTIEKENIIEAMYEAECETHFMATELVKALAEAMLRAVEDDDADNEFYISKTEIEEWRRRLDRIGGYYGTAKLYLEFGRELEQLDITITDHSA